MKITFTKIAWEDYLSWQNEDKKVLKKINALIEEIMRTPLEGRGKPEPLKCDLTGYWSRRIDQAHRLVYQFRQGEVLIYGCRFPYDD
jgi:toxin YoeB